MRVPFSRLGVLLKVMTYVIWGECVYLWVGVLGYCSCDGLVGGVSDDSLLGLVGHSGEHHQILHVGLESHSTAT
jgi:hypothetical protein